MTTTEEKYKQPARYVSPTEINNIYITIKYELKGKNIVYKETQKVRYGSRYQFCACGQFDRDTRKCEHIKYVREYVETQGASNNISNYYPIQAKNEDNGINVEIWIAEQLYD